MQITSATQVNNVATATANSAPRPTTTAAQQNSSPTDRVDLSHEAQDPHVKAASIPVPPASSGFQGVADYTLALVKAGLSPQEAADQTNKTFGLGKGSEAVYYPDGNCIGLPEYYLAGPTDRPDSPKDWTIVKRSEGGGAADSSAPAASPAQAPQTQPQSQAQAPAAAQQASTVPGMTDELANDPDIQRTIEKIKAEGGEVLQVEHDRIQADMKDDKGPVWVPVEREKKTDDKKDQKADPASQGTNEQPEAYDRDKSVQSLLGALMNMRDDAQLAA